MVFEIDMPETLRRALLSGTWDSTATLLSHREEIVAHEKELPYRFTAV